MRCLFKIVVEAANVSYTLEKEKSLKVLVENYFVVRQKGKVIRKAK